MSIDLSQFHAVFFEESFEGLELMEAALLDLDVGNPDSEQINAIFRAAHSIKGGSGTFGFVQVAEFTHILETLLDKVRDGEQAIDADGYSKPYNQNKTQTCSVLTSWLGYFRLC